MSYECRIVIEHGQLSDMVTLPQIEVFMLHRMWAFGISITGPISIMGGALKFMVIITIYFSVGSKKKNYLF